jgi:hypothetical protein
MPESRDAGLSRAWLASVVIVAIVAAAVATWPLPVHLLEAIPGCPTAPRCHDNRLCVWIVGEAGRRLYTDPLHVFEANIFHPLRHTLAYSESMLSAGLLVAPINWVSGNPLLGYNLYYIGTYALSIVGGFLLVWEITRQPAAALLAGLLFGLADEHWWFRGHLPAISAHWAPFVLWTWIRFLDARTFWRGAALAAVLLLHFHAGAYHGVMLPVLCVPWAATLFLAGPWSCRAWLAAAAVIVPTTVVGLALYLPYLTVHEEIPFEPRPLATAHGIERYWTGIREIPNELAHPFDGPRTSDHSSPLPIVLLAAAAVVLWRRPTIARRTALAAHCAAIGAFAIAAALLSVDPLVFRPGIAGSEPRAHVVIPGLFSFLQGLPGFSSMRSPGRFSLLAVMGGAILTGIAVDALLRRSRSRPMRHALVGGLAAVILLDARTLREPFPVNEGGGPEGLPAVYRWLAANPSDAAIWELPNAIDDEPGYMIHSLYHDRRLANGYSAIMPRLYEVDGDFPTSEDVAALQDAGIGLLVLHTDTLRARPYGPTLLENLNDRAPWSRQQIGAATVLTVPERSGAKDATGAPVGLASAPRAQSAVVLRTTADAAAAVDGDLGTHWTAAPGRAPSQLRIDLGAAQWVRGLTLHLGPHVLEYPRSYAVWASRDGASWQQIGGEPRARPPFTSYRHDHRRVVVPLRMQAVETRYLEIRVPGAPRRFRLPLTKVLPSWGVHELSVTTDPSPAG